MGVGSSAEAASALASPSPSSSVLASPSDFDTGNKPKSFPVDHSKLPTHSGSSAGDSTTNVETSIEKGKLKMTVAAQLGSSAPSECPMRQTEASTPRSGCPMHQEPAADNRSDIDPKNMVRKFIKSLLVELRS